LTLFMIPEGFKRVTLDEFMEDMTRPWGYSTPLCVKKRHDSPKAS
jgi:hypothetical protein